MSRARSARRGKAPLPPVAAQHRDRLLLVAVALLAVLPYLNGLTGEFAQDDLIFIVSNPMVMGTAPASDLLTWVQKPEIYRPLTMLMYAAEARVHGSPMGFHLLNVVLHALVTLLVLAVGRLVLRSTWPAAAAAALFAVHPVHTEAVTSIAGRAELLAALLALLAVVTRARADQAGPAQAPWWELASVMSFAGAVLSKESALTALGLCVLIHLWVAREQRFGRALRVVTPYLLVAIAYLGWRAGLIGALTMPDRPDFLANPLAHVGVLARVETALVVLVQSLGQLTVPISLSSDYSYAQIAVVAGHWDPRLLLALVVLGVLALALGWSFARARGVALAAAFFFVPLAVTANVFFPIGTIRAERLLYLPSVGWCLAAAWLVDRLRRTQPRLVLAALAIVVTLFGVRTWLRNPDWHDSTTVFAVAVTTAPRSARAHYNWGSALLQQGRVDDALRHLRTSVSILPTWSAPQGNLGAALVMSGRYGEAIPYLSEAVRLDPDNALYQRNLAKTLLALGRLDEAAAHLNTALQLAPDSPEAAYLLGTLANLREALARREVPGHR